jgi:hypothetical protein
MDQDPFSRQHDYSDMIAQLTEGYSRSRVQRKTSQKKDTAN